MLTMSASLDKYGFINGMIMMLLTAFSLYLGLYCFRSLLLSYKSANIYSELVEISMGKKAAKLLNWIFLIYIVGCLIGFLLVTYNLLQIILLPAFESWFGLKNHTSTKVVQLLIILSLGTITLPFTLQKTISKRFSTISQFTFIAIIYVVIVLFVQIFSYNKHYEYKNSPRYTLFCLLYTSPSPRD